MGAIDYTDRAGAFRRRRTLPAGLLERWRAAVAPRLPVTGRVLDLGAGTGQFAGPLHAWTGAPVVAVEPSPAMRAEAVAAGLARGVALVAARAEALPLPAGSVDLAWLSTVVHQFDDLAAAAGELARVLRPGGRVLVRNYLADQGRLGFLDPFPGIERSVARFPTTERLAAVLAGAGLDHLDTTEVVERWPLTLRTWADALPSVRDSDSMFVALTDDEFAAGVAAVRAEGERDPDRLVELPLRLVTFASPG